MSVNTTSTVSASEAAAEVTFSGEKGLRLGPFLMGLFIDAVLCGIMVMQFSHWVSFSRNERMLNRIIVYASIVLSVIVTVYMIAYNMHLFVYGFGTYINFASTEWLCYFLVGDAIVAVLVQVFFAERAYRLMGNSKILLVALGLMMLLGFAGCIGTLVGFKLLTSTEQVDQLRALVYCWLGGQLAADLTLTGTIMYGLFKSRTGWSETDKLVNRLVTLSMETQLPPTIIAFVFLVSYSANSTSLVDATFDLIMSKFYICGLLGALNSRYALRREMNSQDTQGRNSFQAKSNHPTQATVHIATETYTESHRISTLRVGLNRSERNHDDEFDSEDGKENMEMSDLDGSSARKLDYVDNASRTVLTA